jgi:hypothetical protein
VPEARCVGAAHLCVKEQPESTGGGNGNGYEKSLHKMTVTQPFAAVWGAAQASVPGSPDVAMSGSPLASLSMGVFRERMHSRGIHPPVVEVEQSAHGDGEKDGVIVPPRIVERLHILGGNPRRIVIHLVDESKQRLVLLVEGRAFQIAKNAPHQLFVAQQFRRNCGVRLQSEGTFVSIRSVGGNQLSHARAERRRTA